MYNMQEIGRDSIILTLVTAIFECATEKMELAAALPSLVTNPQLSVILTTDEINAINDVSLYSIEFSKCLPQSASINKNSRTNVCTKETWYDRSRFNQAVYKALKILTGKRIDILRTSHQLKHISMTSALFLCLIRYFLEHVLRRMYVTPEEGRSKEVHFRKLWHCQKKSIEDVARFTIDLERQRIIHRKTLEDTIKRYRKNVVSIDDIDKRCNEYLTNTNVRYEKEQIAGCKAWEYERNEVHLAMANIIDNLEFLRDVNATLEQTMRKQKLTSESKLLAIMTKYDTEIGGRCRMLEKLNEIYEYDKLEKHNSEKEMKRQEKAYLVFIKRKKKIGTTHFYKALATFERECSARIIQRWWRNIFLDREGKEEVEKENEVNPVYFTSHQTSYCA